jgi:hypothetical protein
LFKHPITIVLVSGAVTALLLPQFTRQWQDRQKERELKRSVLEKMSTSSTTAVRHAISRVLGKLQAAGGEAGEDKDNVYLQVRNSWLIDRAAVRSTIVTYFPDVNSCWYSCERAIADYLGLVTNKRADRAARITKIQQYVNSDLRDFYDSPGNVDEACMRLKKLPMTVVARYQELKTKMNWNALRLEIDPKGDFPPAYQGAYQILGEELLIADDRIITTIVGANGKDFSHGISYKDWVPDWVPFV